MAVVLLTCKSCGCIFETAYKYRTKRQFCSRECVDKSRAGAGNPAFGRTYRTKKTHPEWAAKVSATSSARQINSGDSNGMKQAAARARVSATRKALYASDPEMRRQTSRGVAAAWAAGKFDGVPVGRCKWYDHTRPDGSVVSLQGTWEVAFARRLDELGVAYDAHVGRWRYTDLEGNDRSYYPDFYIPMWDVTVDVKGVYWDECGSEKYDAIRIWNCEKTLVIADRPLLESWGVDVLGTQRELLKRGVRLHRASEDVHLKYLGRARRLQNVTKV